MENVRKHRDIKLKTKEKRGNCFVSAWCQNQIIIQKKFSLKVH